MKCALYKRCALHQSPTAFLQVTGIDRSSLTETCQRASRVLLPGCSLELVLSVCSSATQAVRQLVSQDCIVARTMAAIITHPQMKVGTELHFLCIFSSYTVLKPSVFSIMDLFFLLSLNPLTEFGALLG